jgi:hypothetical protein
MLNVMAASPVSPTERADLAGHIVAITDTNALEKLLSSM